MSRLPILILLVLALAPSPAAAATTYHVTPSPDENPDCSPADPCSLGEAMELASSGDEIVLGAGEYTGPVNNSKAITIRGAQGTRPVITGIAEPAVAMYGGALSDVEVVQQSQGVAVSAQGATVERVVARAASNASVAFQLGSAAVLRSSAGFAPGTGGIGVNVENAPESAEIMNVTLAAGGPALRVDSTFSVPAHVTATNSILRGGTADVQLVQGAHPVSATVDHSAFRPGQVVTNGPALQTGAGNLASDPLLAADLIHQLGASPTIDAGAAATGTDVDGEPRTQGAGTDIGADERAKPEPEPTATPTPEPAATASPAPTASTPALDLTLPGVLSADFPTPPVAGRASDLVIELFDPDSPVIGVLVDLGPAGAVGLSACRTFSPPAPGQAVKLTIPVIFPAPGLQSYALEIRSGGCGSQQSSRSEFSTQVQTGALVAHASQAKRCRVVLPKAGNEQQVAAAVICLMNRERARRRLRPLTPNPRLAASAAAHTADMLAKGYYNHQRPGGPTLTARTRRAKYRGGAGENLGLANGLLARPDQMMKMWMKSPMHRANILMRRFRAVGVSVQAKDPMKRLTGAAIYTVNFGTRR